MMHHPARLSKVILVYMKKSTMRLHILQMKIKKTIFVSILSLGLHCITQTAATIMQVVMNNSLVYYGDLTSTTTWCTKCNGDCVKDIPFIITTDLYWNRYRSTADFRVYYDKDSLRKHT